MRCPARALEAAFRPACRELFAERFFGRSGLQTAELMVGDRPREDVAGAKAAGLQALLFDPRGRSPGPDAIRDLRQVPRRALETAR